MSNEETNIGKILDDSRTAAGKRIVQISGAALMGAGLIWTGIHNFNLFSRTLPDAWQAFAVLPVILIEGSIVAMIAGQFVWFGFGLQKQLATIFGWSLFGIAAVHLVVDSSYYGQDMPPWLSVYSKFALPAIPAVIAAMWKSLYDADPIKKARDLAMAEAGAIQEAQYQARRHALSEQVATDAIRDYARATVQELAAVIRAQAPAPRLLNQEAPAAKLVEAEPAAEDQEPDDKADKQDKDGPKATARKRQP